MSSKTAPMTSEFRKSAHRAIDDAADKVESLEENARERASEARENVTERAQQARETTHKAVDQLGNKIREKPLAAAGIAFAAGILTSMFLRRRSR